MLTGGVGDVNRECTVGDEPRCDEKVT
jgi:hypothetical protein